jgi:DNA modification methylase
MTSVQLLLGDCLELMRDLPDGSVDAVVTDPPYEVGFADWDTFIGGWLEAALMTAPLLAFTPGIANIQKYPQPTWVLCWAKPGSTRRNGTGGFNHWEPVFVYGKRRIWVDYKWLPDCVNHAPPDIGHPCPKPVSLISWLVEILSDVGATILDPFMGSGTTGVACVQTGRNFIGMEIDPTYFAIAERRIREAQMQPRLPMETEQKAEQPSLLDYAND